MESLAYDVRFAFRALAKRRGLTAVAVASLAIGIAINVAVFTVLAAILLRPLAVPVGRSLVMIGSPTLTYAQQAALRDALAPQGDLMAFRSNGAVSLGDGPRNVPMEAVSENYFSALGLRAVVGRLPDPGDVAPRTAEPEVVLSHSLWTRQWGRDPGVVGREVRLGEMQVRVIGVTPPGFRGLMGPMTADIWIVASQAERTMSKAPPTWNAMLRVRDGFDVRQGRPAVEAALSRLPDLGAKGRSNVRVIPLVEMERILWALVTVFMMVPGLVLAVACANVSGLLAARADERGEEMAVRLAIGGDRRRLIRQLMAEGGVLAAGAAGLGLLLARWIVDGIAPWLLPTLSNYALHPELTLDARAVAVSVGLAGFAAVAASLLPALAATRPDLTPLLKGGGSIGGGRRRRLPYRESLVVGQLVVTFAFLVTAVLCSRSFARSLDTPLGFDADRLLVASLYRSGPEPRFDDVLEAVRGLAGVRNATLASAPPAVPPPPVRVRTPERGDEGMSATENAVRAEYFALSGARLLRGRLFEEADIRLEQPVAVVTAALGRRLFPESDPLGQFLLIGDSKHLVEIVGVVQDPVEIARVEHSPGKPGAPIVYVPLGGRALETQGVVSLLVEGGAGALALGPAVERRVRELQAGVGIAGVRTLAEVNRAGLIQVEITSVTYSVLGILACVLGTVGLYGAVAQMVARRRREIGIRVALGATRREVSRLVLRRGLALAGAGVALGLPAAFAAVRIFGSAVPDLPAVDPATLVAGSVLVFATALLASYGPTRRATEVDPMVVLRHE